MNGSLLVRKRKKLFLLPPDKWFYHAIDDYVDYYERKPHDGKMYLSDVIGEIKDKEIRLKKLLFNHIKNEWEPMIWSDKERKWITGIEPDVETYIKENRLIIGRRPL